jgi:hypothetical protein
MAGLDALSRKGALLAISALARAAPKPLDAMAFAEAAGMAPNNAIRLREDLHQIGIIRAHVAREAGAIREHAITLTDLGLALAPHVLALEEALRRHEEKGQRRR